MTDHTETVVLPANALTNGRPLPPSRESDDGADTAFDQTLVLEDEVEKRRRLRSARNLPL